MQMNVKWRMEAVSVTQNSLTLTALPVAIIPLVHLNATVVMTTSYTQMEASAFEVFSEIKGSAVQNH